MCWGTCNATHRTGAGAEQHKASWTQLCRWHSTPLVGHVQRAKYAICGLSSTAHKRVHSSSIVCGVSGAAYRRVLPSGMTTPPRGTEEMAQHAIVGQVQRARCALLKPLPRRIRCLGSFHGTYVGSHGLRHPLQQQQLQPETLCRFMVALPLYEWRGEWLRLGRWWRCVV